MNKIRNIIAISVFSLMVLALSGVASAQYGGYPYPPRGGYGYPGAYGNNNLRGVARNLQRNSREFERQLDRELGRGGYYGGNRGGILGTILGGGVYNDRNRGYGNDRIKRMAEDFRKSANEFEKRHDNRGRDNRGYQAAMRMINIGRQLDREVRMMRLPRGLEYQWAAIRRDLDVVERAYGGYGRGGGRLPF